MHRLCSVLLGADVTLDTHPGLEPNTSSCSGTTQMLVLFIFSCTETGNLQYAEALEPRQSQGHLTSSAGVKRDVLGWRCPGVGGWRSRGTHSEGTTWCQPETSKPWCPALAGMLGSHPTGPTMCHQRSDPPVETGGTLLNIELLPAAAHHSLFRQPQKHHGQKRPPRPPNPTISPAHRPLTTLLLISPLLC